MKALTKIDENPAWKRHKRLQELNQSLKLHFLAFGEELDALQENKEYEDLGYDRFEDYVADPANSYEFSIRTAYRMMRAYKVAQRFGVSKVEAAGISKVDKIAGYLTDDNADELLNMASTLSRSDLHIEIRRRFEGGNGELEYCVCDKCGNRHKKVEHG